MALTLEEANELAGLQAKYGGGPAAPVAAPGLLGRAAETLADVPSNAAEGVANMFGNILQLGTPSADKTQFNVPKPYNIAPGTTIPEQAIDVAGGIASSLPQYLLPELAIGAAGKTLGVGGRLLDVAKAAGSGAINSIGDTPGQAAGNTALMAAGALVPGGNIARRLLPAAGIGAGAAALSYANGADGQSSLVQGGVIGALSLFGGHPNDAIAPTRTAERMGKPLVLNNDGAPLANPPDILPAPDLHLADDTHPELNLQPGEAPTPPLRLDDGTQQQMDFTPPPPPDVTSQPLGMRLANDNPAEPLLPFQGPPNPSAPIPASQTTLSALQKLQAGGSISDLHSTEFDALTNDRIRQGQPMLIDNKGRINDEGNALLQANQPPAPAAQGELPWFGQRGQVLPQPKSAADSAAAILQGNAEQAVIDAKNARNNVGPMKSAEASAAAIVANKVPLRPNTHLNPDAQSLVDRAAANLGVTYHGIADADGAHVFTVPTDAGDKQITIPADAKYQDLKDAIAEAKRTPTVAERRANFPNSKPVPQGMTEFADKNNLAYNGSQEPQTLKARGAAPERTIPGMHYWTHMEEGKETTVATMHDDSPTEAQQRVNDALKPYGKEPLPLPVPEKGTGGVFIREPINIRQTNDAPPVPETQPAKTETGVPILKASAALGGESGLHEAKIWRGTNGTHEVTEGRPTYALFGTTNKDNARTYMGDGEPHPLTIKGKLIEFPVTKSKHGSGNDFDKFAFDERAKSLQPGEILRAHNVVDIGPEPYEGMENGWPHSYPADTYATRDPQTLRLGHDETPVVTSQSKEPWYMTSDTSHLVSDYQDDAEYIRGRIRTMWDEGDHEGVAYAVEQLKELLGPQAADSPQAVVSKNVTSQSPPSKAAAWLTGDDDAAPAKIKRTYSSKEDWMRDNYEEPDFDTEDRAATHQGELTNELTTQGNDYEVEDDKVGASEYGTDTEDSDDLGAVLDEEREAQAVTKEELPGTTAEEELDPQITDADRKEFGELTSEGGDKSEADKLAGLMGMLEKQPQSPALKKAVRDRTGLGIKKRGSRKNAGFIDAGVVRDALGVLGRYSPGLLAGGSVGAYYDDENRLRGFLIGAAMGGALQRFGPGYIRMLVQGIPREIKAGVEVIKDVTSQPGGKVADLLENLAAEDFGATGQGMASYVRRMTKAFTMSDDAVDATGISNLSGIQHEAADAIKLMAPYYGKLSPAEKAIYAKYATEPWYQEHPDGSRKLDAKGLPIRNVGVETRFSMDMAAHPEFMAGAMSARRLIVLQQEMVQNSMRDGKYRAAIIDSIGKYQTDAFRMFMESKYRPSESKVNKFLDELQYTKVFPDYDRPMLMKTLQSQLDAIYQNRSLYEGGGTGDSDTGTLDQILKSKIRMPAKLEADLLAAVPGAKSVDEIVTSQRVLPKELSDRLAKAIRNGEYLTPAYRDLLGYYNDPMEKTVATMMKLQPAARAASLFSQISNGTDSRSGLPMSLDPADAVTRRADLNSKLSVMTDPAKRAPLEAQLLDLKNRVKLPDSPNLGTLAGRYVPQGMADILPDMNKGASGGSGLPITRAILDYNRALKAGQTILNPVSHVKWLYNAPLLGAMSGTGPGWVWHGFRVARAKDGATYMGQPIGVVARRMEALGIKDTNIAHSEFNTTAKQALTGYLDSTIIDKFFAHPVVAWAAEKYGLSDNAVRIGTFLKREQDVLTQLAPDVARGLVTSQEAASRAEREAIRYTNRYTINYAGTPGGIAYIRKMPFVSLYLTYSYHMARITKNILMDATGQGPYGKDAVPGAIAKLAALSVIPAAIQAAGRAALSPQDQKDWDRSIALDQPYAQPRYRYPLYRKPDGSFKYLDYTAYVPTGDWNMFGRAVMSGDPKQMLAANPIIGTDNTPALNIATEIITGNDSRTGRPINTFGRALNTARQEIAPAFLGGYEFDNLMRALQPNAEGGVGITRLGSGKGYSIGDLLTTYITGLRPTSVNVDWQKHTAVQHAEEQIATEKQFLMDTARSDATEEVKQSASKRYTDAVKMIVSHLQWELGMEQN